MPADPPPFPWLRAAAFLGLSAWMAAGTVHNLVLGLPWNPYLKPWRMYYAFGTSLCEVRYVQREPDGRERALDRYALLGYRHWTDAPEDLRNLPDGPTIGRVARSLCRALPEPAPAVHARVRCATVHGWRPQPHLDRDLCALEPDEIAALRPRPRGGR